MFLWLHDFVCHFFCCYIIRSALTLEVFSVHAPEHMVNLTAAAGLLIFCSF